MRTPRPRSERSAASACPNFIVFGESHLDHICSVYEAWYNLHRPHSSLDNEVIGMGEMPPTESTSETSGVVCESWLGGVLRQYQRAAA